MLFVLIFFRACQNGYIEQVDCLINAGAKCNAHKTTKCTPLYAAIRAGHIAIVKKLLIRFPDSINVKISTSQYDELKLNINLFSLLFCLSLVCNIRELVSITCCMYQWEK